jgi:CPA2 family monovalent cation:H+ antiporter-2
MVEDLRNGGRLSAAARKHPECFPIYYMGILESAELTGRLDTTLESLAGYLERELETRSKVVSALSYPGVVMSMAMVTVVILAFAQPFLPSYAGPVLFLGLLAAFGVALWRSASDLDSHVRAGSEAVVDALRGYALPEPTGEFRAITKVQDLMPGLGATVAVQLTAASRGVGRSLAELDLRGRTGATVLAIRRDGAPIPSPGAAERLREGDVLALTGTADALDAARTALVG